MIHDANCPRSGRWYVAKECREFSTDGTAMGALIAHTMGTTDEVEIGHRPVVAPSLTGMTEEQADWDNDDE
jgi:hypothetical protein